MSPGRRDSLLLPLVATAMLGCEGGFGDNPYVSRTAPFAPEIPANESVRYQVRGCVVKGTEQVDPGEGAGIASTVAARSASSGTVTMELPFVPSDESERLRGPADARVMPGEATVLTRQRDYGMIDVRVEGLDHEELCTPWETIEIGWADVNGTEPLKIDTWQVEFLVEIEVDRGDDRIEVAIDFLDHG